MATGTKLLKKLTIRTFIGGKADILAYAMQGRPQREKKDKDGKQVFEKDGKTPVMEGYGEEGVSVPLMRVLGNVTGYATGDSDFGPYTKLKGQFQATNLQTGEVLEGCSLAILPAVVADNVAGAILAGAESVQFAVEMDTRFSEKAATMYEFEARTLLKPQTPDPLKALMDSMATQGIEMTKPLTLAAPKLSDADKAAQAEAEKKADEAKAAAAAEASKPATQASGKKGK